jgi:hypothetical protein
MEPNMAESIYIRSSIKFLHFVPFRQQIWPPRAILVSNWLMLKKSSPLKLLYMFNVYKDQLSRQTGSRNLTGPKTLPTIWYTYMMLVTKYQISAINSKMRRKISWTEGRTDRRTEVKQYTPSPFGERGYKNVQFYHMFYF